MKRIYIVPALDITEIGVQDLLMTSPSFADGEANTGDAKGISFFDDYSDGEADGFE